MSERVESWQLRAQFAAGLSRMYGAEVPAYHTLVDVSSEVNRGYVGAHSEAQQLGSLERVTAERHGAIRVGTAVELAQVADLFSAFGMYPVGYYDLREAVSPSPDPAAVWDQHFPATDAEMAAAGLAYYRGGDPTKPVVYEDFLPASAAGIFRSNLDSDTPAADGLDDSDYSQQWMAGQIGHHIHDPYDLYEKVACS